MAARTSLSIAQPLPAERFFRVSLFLLLLTAMLTLVGTGKIDLFTSIGATLALLYRARRWWYGHEPELTSRTATFMVLCYLLFFPVDMFFLSRSLAANSPNPPLYAALISSVHFLIFVLLVRLYSARTDRDAHFLVMLAFAAVLASAVLTVDTTFLFLFFLFLLFAVATYSGLELRRGASGALIPPTASMPTSEKKLARAGGARTNWRNQEKFCRGTASRNRFTSQLSSAALAWERPGKLRRKAMDVGRAQPGDAFSQ